jgi:hypothetical protein
MASVSQVRAPSCKMLLKRVCFPHIRMLPRGSARMPRPTAEPMSVSDRRKYLQVRKALYLQAGRTDLSGSEPGN